MSKTRPSKSKALKAPFWSSGLPPSSRLQTPGSRLQAAGSRLQAPCSRLHAPGLQDPGSRLQAPGSRIQPRGSKLQVPGSRLQAPGWGLQAPAGDAPEAQQTTTRLHKKIPGMIEMAWKMRFTRLPSQDFSSRPSDGARLADHFPAICVSGGCILSEKKCRDQTRHWNALLCRVKASQGI